MLQKEQELRSYHCSGWEQEQPDSNKRLTVIIFSKRILKSSEGGGCLDFQQS